VDQFLVFIVTSKTNKISDAIKIMKVFNTIRIQANFHIMLEIAVLVVDLFSRICIQQNKKKDNFAISEMISIAISKYIDVCRVNMTNIFVYYKTKNSTNVECRILSKIEKLKCFLNDEDKDKVIKEIAKFENFKKYKIGSYLFFE